MDILTRQSENFSIINYPWTICHPRTIPIWDDLQGLALLTDTEVLALRDYVAERDMMRSDDELSVDAADEKSASPSLETEVIASAENFSRCETRQASTKFAPVIEP